MQKCDHKFITGKSALKTTWKPKIYYCHFCEQEGTLDDFENEKRKIETQANKTNSTEGYMHVED